MHIERWEILFALIIVDYRYMPTTTVYSIGVLCNCVTQYGHELTT